MQTAPAEVVWDAARAQAWDRFQQTLALAEKILRDRDPKARRKTLSVHDPESRRGKHGDYQPNV